DAGGHRIHVPQPGYGRGDVAALGEGRSSDPDRLIRWHFARFAQLTPREVHDLYRLRVQVFVVEQNCVFQDVDGVDPECFHLLGYQGDELVAYARLLPAGVKFDEPSIGRVITAPSIRRKGMGRVLMAEAMSRARELWPGQ